MTDIELQRSQMQSSFALVIPCFNEESRLDREAFVEMLRRTPSIRLVFVDDGSSDGTLNVLRRIQVEFEAAVEVLIQPVNKGKAEAVRVGMLHAIDLGVDLVGFWDADLATPLDAVFDLLGVLSRRNDVDWVLGARVQLLGRDIRRRAIRHYLGRVFATAASVVLSMPVYDTQCGAKLFRVSKDLREVLSRPFVSRWVFDVEMLMRLSKIRSRDGGRPAVSSVFEFPLQQWMDVGGSKVKSGDFLKAALELIRIWRDPLPTSTAPQLPAESHSSRSGV